MIIDSLTFYQITFRLFEKYGTFIQFVRNNK